MDLKSAKQERESVPVDDAVPNTSRPNKGGRKRGIVRASRAAFLSLGALSAVFVAVAMASASRPMDASAVAADDGHSVLQVRVALTQQSPTHRKARFATVLQSKNRAMLAFESGGRLLSRPARAGDEVKAGQVLASLDSEPARHNRDAARGQLRQAQARLSQLRRDVRRIESLVKAGAVGPERLEQLQAAAQTAEAAQEAAEAQMRNAARGVSQAALRAPFAGVITDVFVQAGEMVSPGTPIVSLSGDGGLEVEILLTETGATGIRVDQPAEIFLPLLGRQVSGRVVRVSRSAMGKSRLFRALVELNDALDLMAGMTADVEIDLSAGDGVTVPTTAVSTRGAGEPSVFVVRDGAAIRTPVKLARLANRGLVVTGGLGGGELVIIRPPDRLQHGDSVSVLPDSNAPSRVTP